jgi:hypothetical protein
MVYPPKQTLSVPDGGVGLVSNATSLPLIIGVTAGGVTDTLYPYNDPNLLRSVHLGGPAVELAIPVMERAGGCLLLKTGSSTAGVNSAVTPTRVSTSTGTITVSGTARLGYRVTARIRKTGALGVATFDYSLDGGYTYSDVLTVPSGGTFAVPGTDLTLTFVPGAGPILFEAGDSHAFTATAAHYTTTNLGSAITALLAQIGSRKIRQVYFAGKNGIASAAATMAAAAATHLDSLAARDHFARGIIDMGTDVPATTQTAFASFSDDRMATVYGDADIVSLASIAGSGVPRVPAMNAVAERYAGANLSENAGRKMSGALRGVRAITHDEFLLQSFSESDRITTLRTWSGESGFYVTNGFLKSPAGSDFVYYDWGRTIDEICDTVVPAQNKWILAKLRALADGTGNIDPLDAERIESAVRNDLKARLLDPINVEGFKGHVSAIGYAVNRLNDFLATRIFQSTTRAVPLSPVEGIESTVGFSRSV